MKLSVVIPTYNASETVIDALESVYTQEDLFGLSFEVIVVDDGSTDNTSSLLANYAINKDNLFIFRKSNGGVSSARNLGIVKSSGKWIAFLDSDDKWLPKKISTQFKIIDNNDDIDFLGCARNNETLSILWRDIDSLYQASIHDLLIKMFPQTSTALVKKSLLEKVGYYNESMTHAEDGELWIRICNGGNFFYSPDTLVITGNGKSNFGDSGLSSNLKKMHLGTLKTLEECRGGGVISYFYYCLYNAFYSLKYIRRLLIVKLRRLCFLK